MIGCVLRGKVVALVGALLMSQGAAADTLKYGGAWFGTYDGTFKIADTLPGPVVSLNVSAGAFKMTDVTGPTLAKGSTFMAWCVDIYHFLNTSASGASYQAVAGNAFYSGASAYKVTDLERLASYVFDKQLLTNATQSAAFQLATWEIINEVKGFAYNIGLNDFKVTSGDATAIALANQWLGVVNGHSYALDQKLGIWQQTIAGSTQDLAVFAPVPEPENYAMLAAGLALMGFIARRRRRPAGTA